MKKRNLLCVCLFLMMLFGCQKTKAPETFIVGFDDTFAPMGFKNDQGEIVGFDIELAQEVANRLDIKFTFQNVDWDFKENELANGSIDCIWNGYSITEDRQEKVLFSDPYLDNRQIIIVLNDSGIETKDDLINKVVSVQKNSSAYEAVSEDKDFIASLKDQKLIQFDTNNDCFMDLEARRSDAIVVDETLARYYIKQQDQNIYQILDEDFGLEQYAIGFRKEDTELANKINETMKAIKEDGTFDKIKERWFEE